MGVACELGVAHPPGYPLFTMLSWLGTKVFPIGPPGYRLNLVTVLFAAGGALFHFHAVMRWHMQHSRAYKGEKEGEHVYRGSAWVAVASAGLVNFGPLVWMYSTHAEVFALNNLFVALLLYLVVRYVQERDLNVARLGALCIGLGLSNQHTLILYALPLAAWMMWLGRKQLWSGPIFGQLCVCGLIGLTPYLYLFWAATHAPLGSWGDTSTLRGYPATGFWTHFLRQEYGTFALYSGGKPQKSQLVEALSLYCTHAAKDTLFLVLLAPVGVASSFVRSGVQSYGAIAVTLWAFYMIVFHSLSNLPLDKPLFLGVHMRFWMQPHILLFSFIPIGAHEVLHALRLWRPVVAASLTIISVCALLNTNYAAMDQSRNYFVSDFGRSLLERRKPWSILLTQGDMVTNSVRYLQRCERIRLDVAHLDMPMMTYEWFKTMHGPHFPTKITFPGVQFSVGGRKLDSHLKCCPYSMKAFLDANMQNKSRPVYLVGGWYGSETPAHLDPKGGIPGYGLEHVGMAARIVSANKGLSWKEFKDEISLFNVSEAAIPGVSYDTRTWEYSIRVNYITYIQAQAVQTMDKAVLRGKESEESPWVKEQKFIKQAIAGLEWSLRLAEETPGFDGHEDIYRNLGIAYGRLKCPEHERYPQVDCPGQTKMRDMFRKFLAVTSKSPQQTANEKLVIDNPDKFINLG